MNRTFLVSEPRPVDMDEPVLLTGAGGRVGGAILDGLADAYDWRLLFHSEPAEEPAHEYLVGDVVETDLMREACGGVDAVVHLAGDPRPDAPWDSVLENNIHGTKVLYDAAIDAGVDRLVYASSNHAVGHFETERKPDLYRADDDFRLDGTELPRPGNFYGVSKAAGETLGRFYHDEYGVSVCNIRIGNLTEGHPPIDYERGQAMWLSHRDCAHLHDRALQAEYDHEIVYGISDNDRKYYSLERAKEMLGYEPRDNSAEWDGTEKVVEDS
jgi:NAD+ dependent glucose-6-phosphate dehydrogenase